MYLFAFIEVIVCKPDMSPETYMTYHMHTIWQMFKSNYVRENYPKIKIPNKSCCKSFTEISNIQCVLISIQI